MKVAQQLDYAHGLLIEELCEAATALAKTIRFGDDVRVNEDVHAELGDVLAAIDHAAGAGLINVDKIKAYQVKKAAKLRRMTS